MLCGGLAEALTDSVDSLLRVRITSIPINLGCVMVPGRVLMVEYIFERSRTEWEDVRGQSSDFLRYCFEYLCCI